MLITASEREKKGEPGRSEGYFEIYLEICIE
jgi:hypothetical protein